MTLSELIAKLEEAEEGSKDLDLLIVDFLYPHERAYPPDYTTSLDVALTLVPEHISYELAWSAAGEGACRRARLWDWRRSPPMFDPGNNWDATAPTLPLALCIAALKARG